MDNYLSQGTSYDNSFIMTNPLYHYQRPHPEWSSQGVRNYPPTTVKKEEPQNTNSGEASVRPTATPSSSAADSIELKTEIIYQPICEPISPVKPGAPRAETGIKYESDSVTSKDEKDPLSTKSVHDETTISRANTDDELIAPNNEESFTEPGKTPKSCPKSSKKGKNRGKRIQESRKRARFGEYGIVKGDCGKITPGAYYLQYRASERPLRVALAVQRSHRWIELNNKIHEAPYSDLYPSLQQVIASNFPKDLAMEEEYERTSGWAGFTDKKCREGSYWQRDSTVICHSCHEKRLAREEWIPYHVHQMVTRKQAKERMCYDCELPVITLHDTAECGSCILAYWEISFAARGAVTIEVESRFRTYREDRGTTQ